VEPFLAPVEKPKGLMLKMAYYFARRQFGKVPTPMKVFYPRMPAAFMLVCRKDQQAGQKAAAAAARDRHVDS
jgi:hypothetical protein